MKTLFLLRHAKSSWDYPDLPDQERPLNARGKRDAPAMGQWINDHFPAPQLILSSHSVRTLATISKVAHAMGIRGEEIQTDERLYHASTATLFKVLKNAPDQAESLMLVGHNPGITDFANVLCPQQSVDNIPTCGFFVIRFHCSGWKEASPENAEFVCFQYPKNLR
ncbi:SixA phosphatase family protein [Nafulsella turpanensis]|uniref:SixA phosphatase family protein n=1 Tax=Nafulsella turpanensis TaxID=1265690 RepID=UPI000348658B|nr:histidine phosphatase family protein [Nafulsella turpanensis]